MANSQAATVQQPPVRNVQEQEDLVDVRNFLEGYISDDDPAEIPENALNYAYNVEFLRKMLFRRNGLKNYSLTKPNSNKVLNIVAFYQPSTGLNIIRADRTAINRAGSLGFTAFTPNPVGIVLSGTDEDYFSFAVISDRTFMSNNGADAIREIKSDVHQYIAVGNAPRYKYIAAAFDRVVGAGRRNITDVPTEIGWSGNLNYTEWDPLVDISAGSNNLVASPNSVSDEITGLFFNENSLIIPRQQSLWLGTHLDSGTNPFNFFSAVPQVGADLPRTIKLTKFGLIFTSFHDSSIYVWDLSSNAPTNVSNKISRYLKSLMLMADNIWASFSPDTSKYSLFLSYASTSTVTCITYDFILQNFVVHEYPITSAVEDIDFTASSTTIDELVGTIDGLIGTIDELGGLASGSSRFFGHSNGDMSTYSFYSGLESVSNITITDLGSAFNTDIRSKIFEIPPFQVNINLVRFKFTPYTAGTLLLYHSKDDGNNWTLEKTMIVDATMLNKARNLQIMRSIHAERILWRVVSSDVMCAHNGLNVKILKSGVAKNGS